MGMAETSRLYARSHTIELNRLECGFALHLQLFVTLSPFFCFFGDIIAVSFDDMPFSTITDSQFQCTTAVKGTLALGPDVLQSLSHNLTD